MNSKIKNYVEVLFSDVPRSRKAAELKEEILANLNERYEDYLKEGKSENQAYSMAVASLEDIDKLLSDIVPSVEMKSEIERYRRSKARNIAIAVGLYILGAAFLIGTAFFRTGSGESLIFVGLIGMLVIAAIATGLIIFTHLSVPQDVAPFLVTKQEEEPSHYDARTPRGRLFGSLSSLFWLVTTIVYFIVSFQTGAWHITWVIFLVAAALNQVMKIIYDWRNNHE